MIYTITTCSDIVQKAIGFPGRNYHTVGYYLNKEKALSAIIENRCDLQEHDSAYAVLEAVPEGVYMLGDLHQESWFQWDATELKFKPCEKPEDLIGTYGFSMG